MIYTRRDFGKVALASVPAAGAFGATKLDSKIKNVQLGAITYSLRALQLDLEGTLKALVELGLSEVELMNDVAERYAGLPAPAGRGGGGARGRGPITPEQQAANRGAQLAATEATKKWRLSASMDKYKEIRAKFKDAGIDIQVLCFNVGNTTSDEEIDYSFQMAKALGARAISSSSQIPVAKRVAPFADKHKLMWGGHGHDNLADPNEFATPASFETIMNFSKYIGINLDIGHFVAANFDPSPFIKQHNKRITNLHVKDRKRNHGANTVFGQGETPIKEVLQLVSKEKYKFPCNIEFEYNVPQGSDVMTEMKKCIQYCKDALA